MADTTVTVQTIIANTIARQKDPDKNTWADAELLKYLNKAREFVYNLLILLQSEIGITDGTITMVAVTQEYTLSGNLDNFWAMQAEGVYFSTVGTPLTPITKADAIRLGTTTTDTPPTMFYLTATKLGVCSIPTTTEVSVDATLHCRHYAYQADLALTDTMPWKNIFNTPISFFVDSMAFIRNEVGSAEVSAIYNTLETTVLKIINIRSGKGVTA